MAISRLAVFVSFAMRGVVIGLTLVAVVSSTALARTPTPTVVPSRTDGPSPTVTRTGSPTPTGTPPIPDVHVTVSPNPARSGQLVTLDASANDRSALYQWSQVGGFPVLQIDFVHQAVAHFVAPAVAQVTVATVEVLVSGYNSGPATAEITLLPADAVIAQVGIGSSYPGAVVPIDVTLRPYGLPVGAFEHEFGFGPYASVVDRGGGVPDCEPGAGLSWTSASFTFVPDGCAAANRCTGVHASIATANPIPEDGVAYRCMVALSTDVSPPDEGCSHVLRCAPGTATSPSGTPLRIVCPDGSNGSALADDGLRGLEFDFDAEPHAPLVGDAVRVTFGVHGAGGLPHYTLQGADPIFSGTFDAASGGALGTVSFDLQANCPGTAPLRLAVTYETPAGCPGHTFYEFTGQISPLFPLVVRDSITPIPTLTPTPTPPATPTLTCGATGTPYCATRCAPCPTIREGCLAVDCGYCIQNPTCADGEVCDPHSGGPPYGCCNCVTPTPLTSTVIGGLVYNAAIGRQAPIANAEVDYAHESVEVSETSGSIYTGADGRYRFELQLRAEDVVRLTVGAPGFATLSSTLGASQLFTGQPQDFGLPPLGGAIEIEPGDMTLQCAGSFTVTITNVGAPGETLVITDFSFWFDYGEGVYGQDFTWDISHIQFPLSLASGAHVSFPMSFRAGQFPSRLFFRAISGARDGTSGVVYFGRNDGCATPTPTPVSICPGDCNGDGRVTIDELLRGVSIALGFNAVMCSALDANADGGVSIAELMAAVNRALNGCAAAAGVWEPIGPRSTPVVAIAVDPTDSQTIYAGTPDTVRQTTRSPLHGEPVWNATGLAIHYPRVIAIDPHTPSTIYVAGGDEGGAPRIAKSTDGGASWHAASAGIGRVLDFPTPVLGLAIDPRQTETLYAATSYLLYRTTDGAVTWTQVPYPKYQGIEAFSFTPENPARIYLGLYREGVGVIDVDAQDAGTGTSNIDLQSPVCTVAAAPSQSDVAYAQDPDYGVAWKTTDGGLTWSDIHGSIGCVQPVIDPNDPNVLYAAGNPVLTTTDGGATFHAVGRGLPPQLGVYAIVLDPTNSTTIYIGTNDGIYRLRGAH